jgi:hypothetical protein
MATVVTDAEVNFITDFIRVFRENYSETQPISAATVALGIPAIGYVDRIGEVLKEMESRGLIREVYKIPGLPDDKPIPAYMEVRDE